MAQLMLINPAKRPTKRRRKASPAQLRALAAGRAKRAGVPATNPAPRKRRRSMRAVARTVRRKVRRNPIGFGGITATILDAAKGAGGALAVNMVYDLLPLPLSMKTGHTADLVKAALAVGLGIAAKPLLGRTAAKMSEGALTVIAFQAMQNLMPVTGGAVAGLSYVSPGMIAGPAGGMGEYVQSSGMGEYVGAGGYGY